MASESTYAHWEKVWQGNPRWHLDDVHPELEQFFSELCTPGRAQKLEKKRKETLRIFVPLSGRTFDMLWLAKQGHEVVGVEFVDKAIEKFFADHKLAFTTEAVEMRSDGSKATSYRCTEEGVSITILNCSIFSVTDEDLGGKFHAVWDRGALVAIDPEDRVKYVAVLKSLLLPQGRSLLGDAVRYDQSKFDGPPYSVSEEQLNSLFLESFTIRELAAEKDLEKERYCYLLTLK